MSIKLSVPQTQELKPRITVFGVGGAGGNAVNNMIEAGLEGVEFVVAIGRDADAADHHPDVDLRYDHVDVRLTSHDVGGLSRRDVELARKIIEAARTLGAQPDPDFEEDES